MTIDWDAYRRDYATLSDEQHRELYERVWQLHREQKSASVDLVKRFLRQHPGVPLTEIGSWDGWLCENTPATDERPWLMIDVCESAARAVQARGAAVLIARKFRWWQDLRFNGADGGVLLACHVIEHLSDDDFTEMARAIFPDFSAIYLEAPLPQQGPCDWTGYVGSHVMRMGWDGVRKVMSELGFVERWAERDSVTWRRA